MSYFLGTRSSSVRQRGREYELVADVNRRRSGRRFEYEGRLCVPESSEAKPELPTLDLHGRLEDPVGASDKPRRPVAAPSSPGREP
jgi:hypothetical protein